MTNESWRKSSRSGSQGDNCVEARSIEQAFQVRDSKMSDDSPVFGLSADDFTALLKTSAQR